MLFTLKRLLQLHMHRAVDSFCTSVPKIILLQWFMQRSYRLWRETLHTKLASETIITHSNILTFIITHPLCPSASLEGTVWLSSLWGTPRKKESFQLRIPFFVSSIKAIIFRKDFMADQTAQSCYGFLIHAGTELTIFITRKAVYMPTYRELKEEWGSSSMSRML